MALCEPALAHRWQISAFEMWPLTKRPFEPQLDTTSDRWHSSFASDSSRPKPRSIRRRFSQVLNCANYMLSCRST